MVCEDLDYGRGTQKIMSPGVQGLHNCKEFPVMDVIVLFSGSEHLGEIGTGVPIPIGVFL